MYLIQQCMFEIQREVEQYLMRIVRKVLGKRSMWDECY